VLLALFLFIYNPLPQSEAFQDLEKSISIITDTVQYDDAIEKIASEEIGVDRKIKLFEQLAKKAASLGLNSREAQTLYEAAELQNSLGNFDSAIIYYQKAASKFDQLGDIENSVYCNFGIFTIYYFQAKYEQASAILIDQIPRIKDINPNFHGTILRALGETNRAAENNDVAQNYLEQAVELSKSLGPLDLAASLNRLGVVHYQKSEHQKAKEYLERSMKIARENKLDRIINMNLNDLGDLYFTLKDYAKGIELNELALSRAESIDVKTNSIINLARLYYKKENYAKALQYAKRGLELSDSSAMLQYKVDVERIMAETYSGLGQHELAVEYFDRYSKDRDQLFDEQNLQRLQELEAKYENDKKALEISNLESINEQESRIKSIYAISLLVVSILLIFIVFVLRRLRHSKRRIDSQNKELISLNATKDKFFSIIAHDLRSPMIALQGVGQKLEYFIKNERKEKLLEIGSKIDQSIDQLNHLLNNLLNWATSQTGGIPHHPDTFDITELVHENVELYRSLAKSKEVVIEDQTSPTNVHADINTTSTVIRNILSNAIKFTKPGGKIVIKSMAEDKVNKLMISDQGPGISPTQQMHLFSEELKVSSGSRGEKGFGLGLKLCKEFVEMNKGEIFVESKEGEGTTFIIALPSSAKSVERSIEVA
jgi:signal transduction histidine kinase